jgi:alkylated DNA repair dioxygenase AlkB
MSAAAVDQLLPTRMGDESALIPADQSVIQRLLINNEVVTNLGAGDTIVIPHFLSKQEMDLYFNELLSGKEFEFQQWYHMPDKHGELQPLKRIKVAQATPTSDGRIPHYRFPVNDQARYGVISPMTSSIEAIRQKVNEYFSVEYNHAVVLLYRNLDDCIGYHKDKTLDLDESAPIISVSLGCARLYSLRDRVHGPTAQQEFIVPSGTLIALGPETNSKWYHSIRPEDGLENLQEIIRISVTFRKVLTFRDACSTIDTRISGKGVEYQTLNWPVELKGEHKLE